MPAGPRARAGRLRLPPPSRRRERTAGAQEWFLPSWGRALPRTARAGGARPRRSQSSGRPSWFSFPRCAYRMEGGADYRRCRRHVTDATAPPPGPATRRFSGFVRPEKPADPAAAACGAAANGRLESELRAHEQTVAQKRRQCGAMDLLARPVHVVLDPVEGDGPGLAVVDRARGGGVAVPRLTNRARVDQVTTIGSQAHPRARALHELDADPVGLEREDRRDVAVPEEADPEIGRVEVHERVPVREDVGILVPRGAVADRDAMPDLQGAERKRLEEAAVLRSQPAGGPARGGQRDGIEELASGQP